jgi:hypothetical protein
MYSIFWLSKWYPKQYAKLVLRREEQCFGSGSGWDWIRMGLDPDSIRSADPDPDWRSLSISKQEPKLAPEKGEKKRKKNSYLKSLNVLFVGV